MAESPRQEADSSTDASGKDTLVECPTCGRSDFKSLRGMRYHHNRTHGESIAGEPFACDFCGEEVRIRKARLDAHEYNYCSRKCRDKHQENRYDTGEHPLSDRLEKECEMCGEVFHTKPSDDHRFCGLECTNDWKSEEIRGESHPRWEGGCRKWRGRYWQKQRFKALERDSYSCRVCGVGGKEPGERPDVHHITPMLEFDDKEKAHSLDNLICLCRPHHRKWESLPVRPQVI